MGKFPELSGEMPGYPCKITKLQVVSTYSGCCVPSLTHEGTHRRTDRQLLTCYTISLDGWVKNDCHWSYFKSNSNRFFDS